MYSLIFRLFVDVLKLNVDVLNLWKGNVVFATELARRYGNEGIVSTSLNPGVLL